jgi:riboflavin kinase/FMN adenylyltransferase
MLQDNFAPYYLVTGPNYTFGFKGSGTYRMLLQGAERYGFRAKVCAAVAYGDQMVSSTRIRQCLSEGKLDLANAMLGRPFAFAGVVCHGDHRGHKLGFPTANLAMTSEHIMLPNGVYAVQVSIGEKKFCGVANIGANPTFNGQERRLEVSIIAFKGNIYGQRISVGFCHHLRDERRFATAEQLVSQLHKDEDAVRTFFRL